MRHRKAGIKLNRTSSHRNAMFRNMVTSLFKHERIRTTDVKAKELRRWADNLITLAKRGDLHARRQALSIVREKSVVHKLFEEAEKKYGNVNGGYTRIVKLGRRPGDAAPISMIELISPEKIEKKTKKKKKAKAVEEKKPAAEKKEIAEKKAADEKKEALEEKEVEKEKDILDKTTGESEEITASVESDTVSEEEDEKPEEQSLTQVDQEKAEIDETVTEKREDKKEETESEK